MKVDHIWSSNSLFSKAQLYAEAMESNDENASQFGVFAAFVLEFLVRSAVSSKSPALLAEMTDWNNVVFGLGLESRKKKFVPRSASITELVGRLEELIPEFTREHANFCTAHFARRNSEIHTGDLAFENLRASLWVPNFFLVCDVLLNVIGESLESLFSAPMADKARGDIEAYLDDTAKEALKAVNAYRTVWQGMSEEEQNAAKARGDATSLRHLGHRAKCPACDCVGLLQGVSVGATKVVIDEDGVTERQAMKPESFACVACGLKVLGYSKLLALELGDNFISTSVYEPLDYFEADVDSRLERMVDERIRNRFEDNNEY